MAKEIAKEFPKWNGFTPEAVREELPRLLAEAERGVAAIEKAKPSTYETLMWPLDDATRALWKCWGKVSHMTSVMNSEAWRKLEADFQPQIVAFSLRVGQSKALYLAMKSIRTKDPLKKRILQKSIEGAEHAGVALAGAKKKRFNEIQAALAKLGMDFSNAVIDATKAFTLKKGGKTYTIDDANYPETMRDCADREVREKLYRARVTRAGENTVRIAEILRLRAEMAKILGYENFAALSLSSKCAPSAKAVYAMIDELDRATKKIAAEEDRELVELNGGKPVEPWDVAYLAERLREKKYAYSEEDFKKHFEFEKALKGLFRMTKFLYDVDVVEVKGKAKPEVWHKDVRFFAVRENGETVAHFYLDPYVRNGLKSGGAWMNEFVNRDDRLGAKPLALVVLNLPVPDKNGKTYLPSRELETLFHEFGHATQQMLTKIGDEDAAGINLVEWDAVEVASQFMENWCLDGRTGIKVPSALKAKVKAAKNFRAASACRRQLSFAKTDMLLHSGKCRDANAVKCEVFDHFGFPRIDEDRFLNAFTHIFSGGYAAGYYGYKWAEVMSADCYGAFEEAGLDDDAAVRKVGKAYRDTVLALGGSKSAYDVFKLFRGRKPNSKALLRQQGLEK